jgi:hypothetical protein
MKKNDKEASPASFHLLPSSRIISVNLVGMHWVLLNILLYLLPNAPRDQQGERVKSAAKDPWK